MARILSFVRRIGLARHNAARPDFAAERVTADFAGGTVARPRRVRA
jgi:hypothetical protein